jgi:pimeloyl-ACP methyl ester carboxylesterase
MPFVQLPASAGGARIAYRETGAEAGSVVLHLHGGWGATLYPTDAQTIALRERARLVTPMRSGYGASTPLTRLQPGFHQQAAEETLAVLDALGIERAVLWGHSDGAVIAVRAALTAPGRVTGVVLEALHLIGDKPGSRAFFTETADDPAWVSERAAAILAAEHGDRWRSVLQMNARAWLELAEYLPAPADLYEGRLGQIASPVLILHGGQDPRTEPGELDAICAALPQASRTILEGAGHSPHSERDAAHAVAQSIAAFVADVDMLAP